jgi:zinc/manganese transport system permease protein
LRLVCLDLPTGAAMVCAFGTALALAGILKCLLRADRLALRTAMVAARWIGAAVIALSAIQLAVARAKTSRCSTCLNMRRLHCVACILVKSESATYRDSDEYAERHRLAAEQLIELEQRRRTEGEALDDLEVRRISSFLKSYGEMRKGEQFVMGEVRARARERIRWGASLSLLALALLLAPLSWGRLWSRSAA